MAPYWHQIKESRGRYKKSKIKSSIGISMVHSPLASAGTTRTGIKYDAGQREEGKRKENLCSVQRLYKILVFIV